MMGALVMSECVVGASHTPISLHLNATVSPEPEEIARCESVTEHGECVEAYCFSETPTDLRIAVQSETVKAKEGNEEQEGKSEWKSREREKMDR